MGSRPGVFVVGSSGVGKRTLVSRLLSVDFEDSSESSSQTEVHGWTINTKYYTADVSVWISHVCDDYSVPTLPQSHPHPLVALVMVLDLSELSTLVALQDWVSHTDINKFDLLPHHLAHNEYGRRRLLKATEIDEFGIGSEDTSLDIRGTCLEWCCENNIEFIETCASNPDFDNSLSVDGDCQGIERVFGALSAHMWPGMILKSGDEINELVLPHGEGLNCSFQENLQVENNMVKPKEVVDDPSRSRIEPQIEIVVPDEKPLNKCYEFDELMSEIGNIRDNLRLMPDFQREIAANLAMKMASMFGGDSDDEEEPE